jgi:hypothetical protein
MSAFAQHLTPHQHFGVHKTLQCGTNSKLFAYSVNTPTL